MAINNKEINKDKLSESQTIGSDREQNISFFNTQEGNEYLKNLYLTNIFDTVPGYARDSIIRVSHNKTTKLKEELKS